METHNPAIVIPIMIGFLLIFAAVFAGIIYYYFRKVKGIQYQEVDFKAERIEIPLLAAFIGLKGIKLFAFGHNSLNPKLRFFDDQVEFKCFRTKKKTYADIELVEVFRAKTLATQNLELHFKNSSLKYVFNVVNVDTLKQAVSFLEKKGCSLSAGAQDFLKEV